MQKKFTLMLIICVGLSLVFMGCGGSGGGSDSADLGNDGGDGTPLPGTSGPSSDELIDDAVSEGDIDYETGILYKVYAIFGDERLPGQYKGSNDGLLHGDGLDIAIAEFDTLSPQTQAAIEPFLAPPYYEGSWWDQARDRNLGAGFQAAAVPCTPIRQGCPVLGDWLFVEGTHVKVWYLEGNAAEDIAKAQAVLDAVEARAWNTLTGLMGSSPIPDDGGYISGGDDRLDIVLVDYGKLGSTIAGSCKTSSSFILLRRTMDIQDIRATAVHEFMHTIQFSMVLDQGCLDDYRTLRESTANWAVDYIYNKINQWEHQHPWAYLDETEKSWDDPSPKERPYGAYLFPFYLGNTQGAQIIPAMWAAAGSADQLNAIANAIDLETDWPEFARMNWNREPFDAYQNWDDLSARVPNKNAFPMRLGGDKEMEAAPFELDLPHLSAAYYHLIFDDPAVRTFAFFNGFSWELQKEDVPDYGMAFVTRELTADQKKGAHVQALIKRDGAWQTEPSDWTDRQMVALCQDREEERMEEIVLIFSNSDIDSGRRLAPLGRKPVVLISNMGCGDWQGNINLVQNDGDITETYTVTGAVWEPQGPIGFPVSNNGTAWVGTNYQATSGGISWSIGGSYGDCTYSGTGSAAVGPSPPNTFHNLRFIRSGIGYRSVYLIGMMPSVMQWNYMEYCDDGSSSAKTTAGTEFLISLEPNSPHAEVDESGGYLSGGGTDTHDDTITGSWGFQAVSDP